MTKCPGLYLQYTLLLLIRDVEINVLRDLTEFTIHFATINTTTSRLCKRFRRLFTIHFATINTVKTCIQCILIINLQYTLLLLILIFKRINMMNYFNLQYTLLLLIRNKIKDYWITIENLQYTLLLLIQNLKRLFQNMVHNLQYTLLLLIPPINSSCYRSR